MNNKNKTLLTGDRPTGPLHIGHYFGSLLKRKELQDSLETYIMIADAQATTDNFNDIEKIRKNIFQVALDYLAIGIDPAKANIFIQSCIPELPELTMYFFNLVTIQRVGHNPTVKAEVKTKKFRDGTPAGFYLYPMYQVADIVAFKADYVPVGQDQAPMLELTRHIVNRFNDMYQTDVLVEPEAIYPESQKTLPGFDGQKMSKSLNNAIYLSDEREQIIKKVKKMRSDPNRASINDPGEPADAIAFTYLDIFDPDEGGVALLKEQYRAGGLGDKVVKDRLIEVLDSVLKPIREKRKDLQSDEVAIFRMLEDGTKAAREKAHKTLQEVKTAMGLNYNLLVNH